MNERQNILLLPGRTAGFLLRVLRGFIRNQGFLLSGCRLLYPAVNRAPVNHCPGCADAFY